MTETLDVEGKIMETRVFTLNLESRKAPEFIDITDQIADLIKESKVQNGFVVVFSKHTTAAIKINENEPLLLKDMEEFLEKFASRNNYYRHNDFAIRTVNMTEDECPNGHAHCQHLLMGTSETVPIINGAMPIGQWQRIFMVELDRPRSRQVLVQVIGV